MESGKVVFDIGRKNVENEKKKLWAEKKITTLETSAHSQYCTLFLSVLRFCFIYHFIMTYQFWCFFDSRYFRILHCVSPRAQSAWLIHNNKYYFIPREENRRTIFSGLGKGRVETLIGNKHWVRKQKQLKQWADNEASITDNKSQDESQRRRTGFVVYVIFPLTECG